MNPATVFSWSRRSMWSRSRASALYGFSLMSSATLSQRSSSVSGVLSPSGRLVRTASWTAASEIMVQTWVTWRLGSVGLEGNGAHSVQPVAISVSLHETAARDRTAVRHQIHLEEPGRGILPIGEGTHRHAASDRRRRSRAAAPPTARLPPHLSQGSVDRGGAHRQQAGTDLWRELPVAMPLHGLNQNRQQRSQPLAADPVRCLPDHNHGLSDRVI